MSSSVSTAVLIFNLYKALGSLDKTNSFHRLSAQAYRWLFDHKMIGQDDLE